MVLWPHWLIFLGQISLRRVVIRHPHLLALEPAPAVWSRTLVIVDVDIYQIENWNDVHGLSGEENVMRTRNGLVAVCVTVLETTRA